MKTLLQIITLLIVASSANAATTGHFENKLPDGSTDVLDIKQNWMSIELTRQVGGTGGISNEGVVPYPTVCRVKQFGNVTSEDSKYITYRVKFVALTDQSGLTDTQYCGQYINEFNGRASVSNISFSILKTDFPINN